MTEMKFAPAPAEMVELFNRIIKSLPGAETRKMFGYPAAFANGQMFTGLHGNHMVIRLAPDDLKTFFAMPGVEAFEPMPGRPMKEYAVIPAQVLASEAELTGWLQKSYEYVKALPPKKKSIPKKKKAE